MKKQLLIFLSLLLIASSQANAQVWSYNFGTAADSLTSAGVVESSSTTPTMFPVPSDGTSVARGRVGSGGGKLVLSSYPGIGSGSTLRIQAPTGTSVNRFSLYNVPNPATTFGIKFSFSIGDNFNSTAAVSSGSFYFFLGDGNSYSGNGTFTGVQSFIGLQMVFGALGADVTYRSGSTWTAFTTPLVVPYGTTVNVAMYANNGSTSVTYTDINSTSRTLPADSWDLFLNGVYTSTLSKAQLPTSTNITSFLFYGASSAGNVGNLFLDDLTYTNNIVTNTLPLRLSSFSAKQDGNNVELFWETGVETDMQSFEIERSVNGTDFKEIGSIFCKSVANSSYSFTDQHPSPINLYRLRIQKVNDEYEYGPIMRVKLRNVDGSLNGWYHNGIVSLGDHLSPATVQVFDITGKKLFAAELGAKDNDVTLPKFTDGTYIINIKSGANVQSLKFVQH